MGKAAFVADPLVVDLHVLAPDDAAQLVCAAIQSHIAADRTVDADAGRALDLPGAVGEAGDAVGQRADRTEVDDVAAGLGVHGAAGLDVDDGVVAALEQPQLRLVLPFLQVADAAPAEYAALLVQHDRVGDVVVLFGEPLRFDQLADARPKAHRLVLQWALAALVADRAVERVIEQDEGEIGLLHGVHLLGVRANDHSLPHRHRA